MTTIVTIIIIKVNININYNAIEIINKKPTDTSKCLQCKMKYKTPKS